MELKYYGKPWLQAFKGAYFILLGILLLLRIPGSISALSVLFSFFIGLTGFVLIVGTILLKKKENQIWNISLGIFHLFFALLIIIKLKHPGIEIYWTLITWVLFNAVTELVEAVILALKKNSFFALFIINALLSLLLGLGMYNLIENFEEARLISLGFISLIFGLVYLLSAYLLKSFKCDN